MGGNRKRVNEDSEDYKVKRARNNEAVKKSREKTKQQARETQDRVDKLKADNDKLRRNIRDVHEQLKTLKSLFINAPNTKKNSIDVPAIQRLLEEIDKIDTVDEEDSDSEDDEDSS